jgi:hypothetical protein
MPSHEQNGEDPFGFQQTTRSTAKDKLKRIRPAAAPEVSDLSMVDRAAESVGFVSREVQSAVVPAAAPVPVPTSAPAYMPSAPVGRPTIAINMRVPEDVARAFQRFCKDERYSYPEALEEIMQRAGLSTR